MKSKQNGSGEQRTCLMDLSLEKVVVLVQFVSCRLDCMLQGPNHKDERGLYAHICW